jgi:hypothetical protein
MNHNLKLDAGVTLIEMENRNSGGGAMTVRKGS